LSAAILQLLAIGVNIESFDFIDKPPKDAIDVAFKQLKQLGAIKMSPKLELTDIGRSMAAFPLDPVYSKVIISAPKLECLNEILDIVAMLSTESIFCEPGQNNRDQAMAQRQKFFGRFGDHIMLLNVFTEFTKHNQGKVRAQASFSICFDVDILFPRSNGAASIS
jgi:ATP-dependent RNA helicase DHX33